MASSSLTKPWTAVVRTEAIGCDPSTGSRCKRSALSTMRLVLSLETCTASHADA